MVSSFGLLCIISTVFLNFVSGQIGEAPNSQNRRQTPITRLLEGFVLGVDESIHRLTAPENYRNIDQRNVEQRNDNAGLNPFEKVAENNQPINYFDSVRENYAELSRRIQHSLLNPSGEIFRVPELVNLNFQNKGQKSFIDLSAPFLNIQLRGKSSIPKVDANKANSDSNVPKLPKIDLPDLSGRVKIGGSNEKPITVVVNDMQRSSRPGKPRNPIHNMDNENDQRNKPLKGHVKTPYQRRTNTENLLPFVNDMTGDQGQSRILGDLLFSENSFDKYIRLNLERYGKLLFDTNVLPTSVIETIRGVTRNPFASSLTRRDNGLHPNPFASSLTRRDNGLHPNPFASSLTRRDNGLHPNPAQAENKLTFDKRSGHLDLYQSSVGEYEIDQNSRIILAFTQEGVPMKLKVDPNLDDPLEYLNQILSTAGIPLNVPVDSNEGNPVGNNIMQLGSDISGTQSKVLYLDTTDEKKFQSFLKALQRARRN